MTCRDAILVVICLAVACFVAAAAPPPARAAEWQWSAEVPSSVSPETNAHPRGFLWVPPDCRRVRAILFGQHNMLEEPLFENPSFRAAMARECVAEIWVTPNIDFVFGFDAGFREAFQRLTKDLAAESGYDELRDAPVIPVGHSAAASFPWNFAAQMRDQTLAVISLKGDTPRTNLPGSGKPNPDWGGRDVDGVPGLFIMGEYEWWDERLAPLFPYLEKHPKTPVTVLADLGRGHFDVSDDLARFIGLFVRKSLAARLGSGGKLRPVDPRAGWLNDVWDAPAGRRFGPAKFGEFKGDKARASWAFDRETALAVENYRASQAGKESQLLGVVQNGQLVNQDPKTHSQVNLKFPELDENLEFELGAAFLDVVPEGNPAKWSRLPAGSAIAHPSDASKIRIERICGPVAQIAPRRFAVRFYRMGFDSAKRTGDIWLLASHEGDARFKSAVQQAEIKLPTRLTEGAEQKITFAKIPDQKSGVRGIRLRATSDSGAKVFFYVREGSAEIVGDDRLVIGKIPRRARLPMKVTVVAWQYGRVREPKLKTAVPVEQTLLITK